MHTAARHHSHSHSRRPDPPAPPKWTSATDPRLAQIKRQHKAAMAKLPETERQQLEREYREQRHLAGEWRKKMEVRRAEDERQRIKTLRRHSFVSMEQLRHAPRPQPDDAHARQQVRRSLPAHDQRAAPAPLPAAYQYPATGHPNIAPHHDASYDQQHQEREQDDCCLNAQLVCCDVSSVIGHMLASFISIILTILLGTTHLLIASIFISGCIVLDIIGNIIRFILCFLLCMLIAEEYDFEWNLTRVAFGWARETRWVSRTVKWTTLGYMHREPRAEATHPDVEKGYYPDPNLPLPPPAAHLAPTTVDSIVPPSDMTPHTRRRAALKFIRPRSSRTPSTVEPIRQERWRDKVLSMFGLEIVWKDEHGREVKV